MQCFISLFLVVGTSVVNCLERLVSEVTCYVLSGTLSPTHSVILAAKVGPVLLGLGLGLCVCMCVFKSKAGLFFEGLIFCDCSIFPLFVASLVVKNVSNSGHLLMHSSL